MLALQPEQSIYVKRKRWLRLAITAVLVMMLLAVSKYTQWIHPVELFVFNRIYTPVTIMVRAPAVWAKKYYLTLGQYSQEVSIDQLLEENQRLQAKVRMLNYLQSENIRLKRLLQSTAVIDNPGKIAEITNSDIEGYREEILLNKGSADGVFENQAIIDPFGLVGQVIEIYPHQSRAILITDGRSRVPVYVERTQQRAMVSGSSGKYELELPFIAFNDDIQIGDRLLSSGLGGVFPRGYPVAQIVDIRRNTQKEFMQVILKPIAHLDSMLEVLLVDRKYGDDYPSNMIPVGPPLPPDWGKEKEASDEP